MFIACSMLLAAPECQRRQAPPPRSHPRVCYTGRGRSRPQSSAPAPLRGLIASAMARGCNRSQRSCATRKIPEVNYDSFADSRFEVFGLIIDFDPHAANKARNFAILRRVFNRQASNNEGGAAEYKAVLPPQLLQKNSSRMPHSPSR